MDERRSVVSVAGVIARRPLLSVIVPAYNAASQLPACLNSLLEGQGDEAEVLIVDDGSDDTTAAVLASWQPRSTRNRLIRHAANLGVSAARNSGLDAARGDYVLFVDADDELMPGALPRLQALLRSQPVDILHYQYRVEEGRGKAFVSEVHAASYDLGRADHWRAAFCSVMDGLLACNACYHAALARSVRFRPYSLGEDSLFALTAFCRARSIRVIPDALYRYRRRAGSASVQRGAPAVRSVLGVCREMAQAVEDSGHVGDVRDLLFRKLRGITEGWLVPAVAALPAAEARACWDEWFGTIDEIHRHGDAIPVAQRWKYRLVLRRRKPWLACYLLHYPACTRARVMRIKRFRCLMQRLRRMGAGRGMACP